MRSKRIYSVEHDTVCHACHGNGFIEVANVAQHYTLDTFLPDIVPLGMSTETCDECNGTGVIQRPAEQERF